MVYNFAKICEILIHDAPLVQGTHNKYSYPAINHEYAYKYSLLLDKYLDFSDEQTEAKPLALMYHKMVGHTFKHILHKYKRTSIKNTQYRLWTVYDFHTNQGKYMSYSDYPMTEDICALKKEVGRITPAKIDTFDDDLDKHLDGLNIGALCDLTLYKNWEFKKDFEAINEVWNDMIRFVTKMNEGNEPKKLTGRKTSNSYRLK